MLRLNNPGFLYPRTILQLLMPLDGITNCCFLGLIGPVIIPKLNEFTQALFHSRIFPILDFWLRSLTCEYLLSYRICYIPWQIFLLGFKEKRYLMNSINAVSVQLNTDSGLLGPLVIFQKRKYTYLFAS